MLDYSEKRNYPRMEIECPASFQVVDGDGGGAIVKNLSGGGLLMWLDRQIEPNATLMLEIKPINDITPPMNAEVRVLRCTQVEGGEGSFAVACQISRVLG
ncbi:MAG: PilZ domain-containing protein [Gammaproteobacteria bacterium]|nr:PilZ domain-containing protein [Gammaproteobacteria bacterium]MCB1923818.1 PilZ domain-containing protein [Gammaproteobacteria bacterium]